MKQTRIESRGPTGTAPRVGVVVVTWNKKDYVLRLLDDLADRPYPNWSVLVVDNFSSDGTFEAVRARHPWVKITRTSSNLGGSGGFNTGLQAMLAEGGFDYVWLLDNDVSLDPGALDVLVETLEARPDAGAAGSHMIQMDQPNVTNEIGGDVDLVGGRLVLLQHGSYARLHGREVYEVDYLAACSLLVRFTVLQQVGIWDDFFIHYDDVDWCLRIRAAGYRVLACAASRIRHMSARTKPVTWVLYYDIRNVLYLKQKHLEFRSFHYLYFVLRLLYYCTRDELSGKGYYARLVELALLDFFSGRRGRCDRFPSLDLRPAEETLDRLLEQRPRAILFLEPARRQAFRRDVVETARRAGIRLIGVGNEHDSRFMALPPDAERIRLSLSKPVRALQIFGMALFRHRADALVLDIDQPCGLLGLCARRIFLRVDQQVIEMPGGFRIAAAALAWPIRGFRILVKLALFSMRRGRISGGSP